MAAENRLRAERKSWRQDHPFNFVAKPVTKPDGSQNLFEWDCRVRCLPWHGSLVPAAPLTLQPACRQVPGRESSVWYPGIFPGRLTFTAEYPERPPTFKFLPIDGKPLFHPNIFNDGKICMSIINPPESTHAYGKGGNWSISVTIKQANGTADSPLRVPTHLARSARAAPQILQGVQMFLDESTSRASGREEAYDLYNNNRAEYNKRVKQQVARVEAVPGA